MLVSYMPIITHTPLYEPTYVAHLEYSTYTADSEKEQEYKVTYKSKDKTQTLYLTKTELLNFLSHHGILVNQESLNELNDTRTFVLKDKKIIVEPPYKIDNQI